MNEQNNYMVNLGVNVSCNNEIEICMNYKFEIKISIPMAIRMLPPSKDVFDANLVSAFSDMYSKKHKMYVIVLINKQANKAGKNVYLAIVNPTNNASIEVAKACVNNFFEY